MATPIIDSTINPPDQSGYQYKPGQMIVRQELEGGAPRLRRDQLGVCFYLNCRYTCTQQQFVQLMGFFRERIQGYVKQFRANLMIDTPYVLPYLCTLVEEPQFVENEGLLYAISVKYDVIPNPIRSYTLILNNVSSPCIIDAGTIDYSGDLSEFPVGRTVKLVGTKDVVDGVTIDLDGEYVIAAAPDAVTRTLTNAAIINPAWTTLNSTVSQQYHPTGGAAILLPQ